MKNYSKFASFLTIFAITLNIVVPLNILAANNNNQNNERINFCHAPLGNLNNSKKFMDQPLTSWNGNNGHAGHDGDFVIENQDDEDLCDAIIAQTACADFIDNDGDNLVDANDPGCWIDQNDPNTYNPADTDETHTVTPPPPPPVDACPNVTGIQTQTPCADQICEAEEGNTWNTENQTCTPPAPIDACPNDEDFQETGPCQSDDVCPGDAGIQTNVNQCTPDEENPTDICANMEGNQTLVPEGYHQDGVNCLANETTPNPENPSNPNNNGNGGGGGGGGLGGGHRRDISGLFGSGEVLGASVGPNEEGLMCESYLNSYIKAGANNDPEEVKKLQIFLNQFFEVQNPVTGVYGPITFEMVKKFQAHQEVAVLTPWAIAGLPTDGPTGYVYKTTKRWINILKCPEMIATTPIPTLP